MEIKMGWQPIETAPKDGTRILVWEDSHCWRGIEIAYWGRDCPLNPLGWIGGHCDIHHIDQPIMWMPLPNPPTDKRGEG